MLKVPLLVAFGFLLPLATLAVELSMRMCGNFFVDPIPTIWHVLLVAWVAAGNGILIWTMLVKKEPGTREALVNGSVAGISFVYTLRFIPLAVAAPIMIPIFLLGLLPLAPLSSFLVAIYLSRAVNATDSSVPKEKQRAQSRNFMTGMMIGVSLIFLAELPHTLTRHSLVHALSPDPLTSRLGINELRSIGDQHELLKMCYFIRAQMPDLLDTMVGTYKAVSNEEVRKIYYRVTGVPFNREKKPASHLSVDLPFDSNDPEVAGDVVGGRATELSLKESQLKMVCDSDKSVSDCQWTLIFQNNSNQNAEARTKIMLPPGGVVSDLQLWIRGFNQHASFGPRNVVKQAYKSVVSSMRDPILVTTSGTDCILLQCYPVPPNGGTMKAMIRIASPLLLEKGKGTLFMPRLIENNFDVGDNNSLSITSNRPVLSTLRGMVLANNSGQSYSYQGSLDHSQLTDSHTKLAFSRDDSVTSASSLYGDGPSAKVIAQQLQVKQEAPIKDVIVVLDGSNSMRPYATAISEAMATIPEGLPWSVVLAADEVSALTPKDKLYQTLTPKVVAQHLKNLHFEGGPDNVKALAEAAKLASGKPDSCILWIHGPQPIVNEPPENILPRTSMPPIYSLEVVAGPNLVQENIDDIFAVKSIPRLGTVKEDLERVLSSFIQGAKVYVPVRSVREQPAAAKSQSPVSTNSYSAAPLRTDPIEPLNIYEALAKLWAADETKRLVRENRRQEAAQTAIEYRVVTPVSGAVVLETTRDYANAGLTPGDEQNVKATKSAKPTTFSEPAETDVFAVPEPEMWMLLLVVLAIVAHSLRRKGLLVWKS